MLMHPKKQRLLSSYCYPSSVYSMSLFCPRWSHHLGQNKTGYTFGQVYKCPAPPNRERLITISRSDLSNPALEGKPQVIQFHGCILTFPMESFQRFFTGGSDSVFTSQCPGNEAAAAVVRNELLSPREYHLPFMQMLGTKQHVERPHKLQV